MCGIALSLLVSLSSVRTGHAAEYDANEISTNIRALHLPYGTILDPVFASDPASPDYRTLVGYSRAGDSAIWTGHYLAAEALRFGVTRRSGDTVGAADALNAVRRALSGIQALLDVTGTDVLARCLVPMSSPYGAAIRDHEAGHGIHYNTLGGEDYFWIGNTSRDQYSGVMFGLSVTYEMVDDSKVRASVRRLVTRIVNYLLRQNWNVVMPDGKTSTTFRLRPDQQLAFLQIARRIDSKRFGQTYSTYRAAYASLVHLPIEYDNADDHSHYFKFNLNYINLYSLVHLEEVGSPYRSVYLDAYQRLRSRTASHGNAHFNLIDRALTDRNDTRDGETVFLLNLWLQRPRRDYWVDLTATYASCGPEDRACNPIPVNERVNTDFLWQRSPFLLYGGGDGTIETAAIDYLLSYWFARYYELPV